MDWNSVDEQALYLMRQMDETQRVIERTTSVLIRLRLERHGYNFLNDAELHRALGDHNRLLQNLIDLNSELRSRLT